MNKPRSKERGSGKKDSKTTHIHIRVTPEVKAEIERLAKTRGVSLTDYVVFEALQAGAIER
jgi:uncharacterized protein (DUF1778 family)